MKSILTLTLLTLVSNAHSQQAVMAVRDTSMISATTSARDINTVSATTSALKPTNAITAYDKSALLKDNSISMIVLAKFKHEAKWGYYATCKDTNTCDLSKATIPATLRCGIENDRTVAIFQSTDLTKTPCFRAAVNGYAGEIPPDRIKEINNTHVWSEYKDLLVAKLKDVGIYKINQPLNVQPVNAVPVVDKPIYNVVKPGGIVINPVDQNINQQINVQQQLTR